MSRRVLIVDDEADMRAMLEYHLDFEGYYTHSVPDGGAGLRAMEESGWDVVLLDVHMPGLSGLEVLEVIRARWESQLVIIMSSGIEPRADVEVVGWLRKPFDIAELTQLLF